MGVHRDAAEGFGAGAEGYERGRPSYPPEVVALVAAELGVGAGRTVVDLAAGTGKLTRLLAGEGARVVAVEPVAGMRRVLRGAVPDAEVVAGTAEALPFAPGAVDAVTVAQAFHWFDADAALAEIARVLRPGPAPSGGGGDTGGGLAMIWNTRDESVPWVAELGAAVDWDRCKPYDTDTDWPAVVHGCGRFTPLRRHTFAHEQVLDTDGLVERMLSTSYVAARPPAGRAEVADRVRAVVAGFPEPFALPYVTQVYVAHRAR